MARPRAEEDAGERPESGMKASQAQRAEMGHGWPDEAGLGRPAILLNGSLAARSADNCEAIELNQTFSANCKNNLPGEIFGGRAARKCLPDAFGPAGASARALPGRSAGLSARGAQRVQRTQKEGLQRGPST